MRPVVYTYNSDSTAGRDAPDALDKRGTPIEIHTAALGDAPMDGAGSLNDSATATPARQGRGKATNPLTPPNQISAAGLRQITADRPIFTLSVAADLLGLHPRTLRIYEEKGLVVPARTDGNRRRYSQIDIERFQAIRLLTTGGVNLEGVRIILEMSEELSRLGSDPNAIIERNLLMSDE